MGLKALLFFTCAGLDLQIPIYKNAKTPIARLNHCRKAEELAPSMFRLHEQRPREENAMFRSSDMQSAKEREESEPVFDTSPRVS